MMQIIINKLKFLVRNKGKKLYNLNYNKNFVTCTVCMSGGI